MSESSEDKVKREHLLLVVGLLLALAVVAGAAGWSLAVDGPWFGPAELGMFGMFALASAVAAFAVIRQREGLRVGVAVTLTLGAPLLRVSELLGHPLDYRVWDSDALGNMCAVVCVVGVVGLLARHSWARWLALAAAAAGIGTSGLNGVGTLAEPSMATWVFALSASGSAIVGLTLAGSEMRTAFESGDKDSVWRSPDPIVRGIRWTLFTQLIAIPMLLVYGSSQAIVPATGGPAIALAFVLGAAAVLCVRRKILGALLLALGGPALLILTAVTVWQARHGAPFDLRIAGYYALFWVPAGIVSTVASVVLARPVLRLWRRLSR